MRYTIQESIRHYNTRTGATASVYGAAPWVSDADKVNWVIQSTGWVIRDNDKGIVFGSFGMTKDEAQSMADSNNARNNP